MPITYLPNIFTMKKLIALAVMASFFLAACGGIDARPEKERFISAMVEATCLIFEADMTDERLVEDEVKEIFKKHGFDVDNEEEMMALQMKYEDMPEVEEAVKQALRDCAPQEFIDAMDAFDEQEDFVFDDDFVVEEVEEEEEVLLEEEVE